MGVIGLSGLVKGHREEWYEQPLCVAKVFTATCCLHPYIKKLVHEHFGSTGSSSGHQNDHFVRAGLPIFHPQIDIKGSRD